MVALEYVLRHGDEADGADDRGGQRDEAVGEDALLGPTEVGDHAHEGGPQAAQCAAQSAAEHEDGHGGVGSVDHTLEQHPDEVDDQQHAPPHRVSQPAEERHADAVRHQPHAAPQADNGLRLSCDEFEVATVVRAAPVARVRGGWVGRRVAVLERAQVREVRH